MEESQCIKKMKKKGFGGEGANTFLIGGRALLRGHVGEAKSSLSGGDEEGMLEAWYKKSLSILS